MEKEVIRIPIPLDDERATSLKLLVVLSKAYKAIMEQAVKDVKRYGLSPSEFSILEVLFAKGRVPLQQIGEKVLITSGSMTYNIDKLETKGLLRRVPSAEDRRVVFAELTEAGNELFHRIFPEHADNMHAIMQIVPLEERRAAIELLKKLGKGVKGT